MGAVVGTKSSGSDMSSHAGFLVHPLFIIKICIGLQISHASLQTEGCGGPLRPKVVQSTAHHSNFPASSVLILAEGDAYLGNNTYNYWLAENQKTAGQGFTMKVDTCPRMIVGFQIKNLGKGTNHWATKELRVSSSRNKNGPWQTLVADELEDTTGSVEQPASLFNFTFAEPVELQFLKFDLISNWGSAGGGLQYFAPVLDTSGPAAETTTDSAIGTTTVEVTNESTAETTTDSAIGTTIAEIRNADEKPIGFYFLISIPVAFTIFGLGYMIQ